MLDARFTNAERSLPATKGDLADGLRYLETKIDGKADKSDLDRFATNDDLKRFATKEDLKKLATKEDLAREVSALKAVDERIIGELLNVRDRVDRIEENMATKDDVRKILNAVDTIAKKSTDYDEEFTANRGAHQRFEGRLEKLEAHSA